MSLYNGRVARGTYIYAGTAFGGPVWVGDPYQVFDCVFNGTSSKIDINGGTQSTGDCGSNPFGGFTLCAAGGNPPSYFAGADIAEVIVCNDEYSNRYQIIQYLKSRYGI